MPREMAAEHKCYKVPTHGQYFIIRFRITEWLQRHQDGTGTVDAIVPSIAGLNKCSKPQLPSAGVAQLAVLWLATPVTGVRVLPVPFFVSFS